MVQRQQRHSPLERAHPASKGAKDMVQLRKGLSQSRVAYLVQLYFRAEGLGHVSKCSGMSIHNYETGVSIPKAPMKRALAHVYGVTVETVSAALANARAERPDAANGFKQVYQRRLVRAGRAPQVCDAASIAAILTQRRFALHDTAHSEGFTITATTDEDGHPAFLLSYVGYDATNPVVRQRVERTIQRAISHLNIPYQTEMQGGDFLVRQRESGKMEYSDAGMKWLAQRRAKLAGTAVAGGDANGE